MLLTRFSIHFSFDENSALLRRNMNTKLRVPLALRLKLNRAMVQIIRNKELEENDAIEPHVRTNVEQSGVKKSQESRVAQNYGKSGSGESPNIDSEDKMNDEP